MLVTATMHQKWTSPVCYSNKGLQLTFHFSLLWELMCTLRGSWHSLYRVLQLENWVHTEKQRIHNTERLFLKFITILNDSSLHILITNSIINTLFSLFLWHNYIKVKFYILYKIMHGENYYEHIPLLAHLYLRIQAIITMALWLFKTN